MTCSVEDSQRHRPAPLEERSEYGTDSITAVCMNQPVAQSLGRQGSKCSGEPVTGSSGVFRPVSRAWLLCAAVVGVQLAQVVSGGGQ